MNKMLFMLTFWVALVGCYSGTNGIVNKSSLNSCGSYYGQSTDWRMDGLDEEVESFYLKLATGTQVSADSLLKGLANNYNARGYSFSEFAEALVSLRTLIEEKNAINRFNIAIEPDEESTMLPGGLGVDPAVLVIDPTCDSCKEKLAKFLELSRMCPEDAPPLSIKLLAGEAASRDAVAILSIIRSKDPSSYADAVTDFLSVLSESPSRLGMLAQSYLGQEDYRSLEGFDAAFSSVDKDRVLQSGHGIYAPLLVFRGRVIEKTTSSSRSFDPFHDYQTLAAVFRLVTIFDERQGVQR